VVRDVALSACIPNQTIRGSVPVEVQGGFERGAFAAAARPESARLLCMRGSAAFAVDVEPDHHGRAMMDGGKDDSPGPFVATARLVANGSAPEWLMLGLAHFSEIIAEEPIPSDEARRLSQTIKRMHDAADYLIKWLPTFYHTALLDFPDDVAVALRALPRVKRFLAKVMNTPSRAGEPRPDVRRQTCAGVVVEAWRIVHGEPEPESPKLWEACNAYWQACGHEYQGNDTDTWERDCRSVADGNYGRWIRVVLLAYRT
jgi:hypothetical protein